MSSNSICKAWVDTEASLKLIKIHGRVNKRNYGLAHIGIRSDALETYNTQRHKPDNILLTNKEDLQVCLSDLGLACNEDDKEQIDFRCGTPGYVAPEVLKGYGFSPKCDIFSLGCLLYNLITDRSLFMGSNQKEVLLANKFKNPLPVIGQNVANVSNECKNLLQWMV